VPTPHDKPKPPAMRVMNWKKLIQELDECDATLTEWEIEFVASFIDKPAKLNHLTDAQKKKIRAMHQKYTSGV
jgi:hypothetical protein